MTLKLNIYNEKKEITKTYEADSYELMFGTIEDLIESLNLDSLKTDSDIELIGIATNTVLNGYHKIKHIFKDIFEGLTDDELKRTKVSELANILIKIVQFSISRIGKSAPEKN